MRRRFLIAIALLAAPSLFAQVRVSAFASDVFQTDAKGFGAALEFQLRPRWAIEVAAAQETHAITTGLFPLTERDVRTHPIDVTLHYYFVNQTRWQPFLGAGVRYLSSGDDAIDDRTSAEIDGGFHFMITPSFSVRADARVLARNFDESYDPFFKVSAGVGWKF